MAYLEKQEHQDSMANLGLPDLKVKGEILDKKEQQELLECLEWESWDPRDRMEHQASQDTQEVMVEQVTKETEVKKEKGVSVHVLLDHGWVILIMNSGAMEFRDLLDHLVLPDLLDYPVTRVCLDTMVCQDHLDCKENWKPWLQKEPLIS